MFYVIMKFKKGNLCHKLYTIVIMIFQYLTKFIYKFNVLCHYEIYFMSFYIRN